MHVRSSTADISNVSWCTSAGVVLSIHLRNIFFWGKCEQHWTAVFCMKGWGKPQSRNRGWASSSVTEELKLLFYRRLVFLLFMTVRMIDAEVALHDTVKRNESSLSPSVRYSAGFISNVRWRHRTLAGAVLSTQLSKFSLHRLQTVQNAAARSHITPILISLTSSWCSLVEPYLARLHTTLKVEPKTRGASKLWISLPECLRSLLKAVPPFI